MRRKARMRFIIFLLTITLGILALSQANSLTPSVAGIQQTPPTGTYFDHLVFIMMENWGIQNICGRNPTNSTPCNGSDNPYMSSLARNFTIGQKYTSVYCEPKNATCSITSQPNYVAIIGGSTFSCPASCSNINAPTLVDRFQAVGLTWKAYMENQQVSAGCDTSSSHPPYDNIHNPFISFSEFVQNGTPNATLCNKIVLANPTGCGTVTDCTLVNDLNNASSTAPNFMWLTPNDCNNMHGASVCANNCKSGSTGAVCRQQGDLYLKSLVPSILTSRTFTSTRSALFITFDEGQDFCPFNGSSINDCIYSTWAGPVAKTGFIAPGSHLYNHYNFTRTVEANWNLATLTSHDAGSSPMIEYFATQSPDFAITASPTSLTFPFGNSANSTITINSLGSFAGTVTLTKSSTPSGLTLTLNPTSVVLTAGGSRTSTLSASSSQIGNYTATVTGTSGAHIHNTTLTVRVTPPPNFVISANPSSLTLTHSVSGVASPVTVNSTGDPTVFESSYLANSFYAKGLIWLFYEDSANTCEHRVGCLTYTTSLNGSKWAPPTTVPVHITDSDFSVTTNGTSVFYVRYNETTYISDCGRRLQFGLGSLNTSGTVTWQPERTVAVGASNRAYPDDEIIVDSNGQVWIGFLIDNHGACGGSGTDLPQVIHSAGTNYSSWTGNFTLTNSNSGNWHIALASLGNGQVYASYWIANIDVHGRLYNSGWQADEQISTTATKSDVNGWLYTSGTNVYMIYFDDTTKTFYFAARSSTGIWTINTIGIGESHTGFAGYYSLPDAASYDAANNQFHLFYLNSTRSKIDEWTGSGNSWNKTTGVVNTTAVPYPDSITSFIQSNPTSVGGIFYISGSTSPFTVNFAALSFTSTSLTGSFTITVASQNGFSGTVTLSTSTNPSTGLTVTCTVTTITGGSGSSTCNLSSTTVGSYNVNVTGVSGSLSHSANVAVTVPAGPDFTISATSPAAVNAGQSATSTITISTLNGFTGTVSLTDVVPANLTCGAITPSSVTNSGTATVACSSAIAATYTLTITGTSGQLSHSTTATFTVRDFSIAATSPTAVQAGTSATSTITVAAVNGFTGTVTLTDTVPANLSCGAITPGSVTNSGTATVACSSTTAGTYTVTITGTSGTLSHSTTATFTVTDYSVSASSPAAVTVGTSATSTITVTAINGFTGTVALTDTVPANLSCGAITPSSIANSGTATLACSSTIAGTFTVTITGTSGTLTHTATAVFTVTDFSVAATSPAAVSVGTSATSTITVTAINGFTGTVSLADTVPANLTCGAITPTSVTNSGTATVACSSTIAATYTLTITGTSGTLSHSTTATFTVTDFTISATSPAAVNAGFSATSTITVTAVNGFTGTVSLTDTVPANLTCGAIAPTSVTNSGTATVSCSSTVAGNYVLTMTGTSGTLSHSTTATFTVRDFSIAATSSAAVTVGSSATSTISLTALNGFTGTVALTDTVPANLTCGAITPTSITNSGTATLTCSSTIAANYVVTVTGTSGTLSHSATATFSVTDFTIAATSPASVTVGTSATSTITVSAVNGFTGTVSLTDTVPANLTCGAIIPTSVTNSGTATVSCSSTIAATYTQTITGTSGTLSRSMTATFTVTDFTIAATSPAAVQAGTTATSTITITAVNGFTGTVTLTDIVPANLTCGAISPGSIVNAGTAILTCSSTIAANYSATVTGTSGTLTHSATATFTVTDFTIVASSPAAVNAGQSATSTVTIASVNGFAGVVTLTDTVPSGLTCGTIAPGTVTGSGTAAVSCNSTTAGTLALAITGTSGSLVHTSTATFNFVDFTITASTPATVNAGQSSSSTITITAANGFTGVVTLTETVPSGLNCGTISPGTITGSGTAAVSCTTTVAGTYVLTVTGTSGTLLHTATAAFNFVDFTIAASPPTPTNTGSSANSTITITAVNGFVGAVSLNDSVPSGLTCATINPTSVTGSGTATVSCNGTIAGNYTLTITGTSGSLSHSATVFFSVQDYAITTDIANVQVNAGSSGSSIITITPLNHFSATVSLSAAATPGLTSAISPTSLSGGSGTASLTFSSNTAGNYTATITSSSGTLTHTASISVQVVDLAIAANPVSVTILAGTSGNSIISISALNGFSGTASLTLTPSMGLVATVVPTSITRSGSSTMTVGASMSGDYSVTVKAVSGSLSHTIAVVIHVLDYSLAGNPVNLAAPIGSSTSSTVTLQSLNGYSGNVSLAYAVQDSSTISSGGGLGSGSRSLIMAPPAVLPLISFNPQSFQFSPGGTQQSTVSISLPSNLPAGNYLITVIASDGTLSHQIVITLAATDFTITATPSSVSIRPSSNTTIVLNLQSLNFFQGNVTLTVNSPSGGPNGTLATPMVRITFNGNANLNLTIQVPANTALGNYTITVQATSGSVSHTVSIPVAVTSTGFVTILAEIFSSRSVTPITALALTALLTTFATLKVRTYARKERSICSGRRIQNHNFRGSEPTRYVSSSFSLPLFWSRTRTDSS